VLRFLIWVMGEREVMLRVDRRDIIMILYCFVRIVVWCGEVSVVIGGGSGGCDACCQ